HPVLRRAGPQDHRQRQDQDRRLAQARVRAARGGGGMMPGAPDFADWLAICNLKAAYCRLLDAKDWEGWGGLFTEDFLQDVSGSGGGVFQGREAAVAATRGSIDTAKTAH